MASNCCYPPVTFYCYYSLLTLLLTYSLQLLLTPLSPHQPPIVSIASYCLLCALSSDVGAVQEPDPGAGAAGGAPPAPGGAGEDRQAQGHDSDPSGQARQGQISFSKGTVA